MRKITHNKRNKIKTVLVLMLCILMFIPNSNIFADEPESVVVGTNRTEQAFFDVTDITIHNQEIIRDSVVVWDLVEPIIIRTGQQYKLSATWGAVSTVGWQAGDYLIFDLPMSDITRYIDGAGALNNGYGTWEIIEGSKVKFTLSAAALVGISLDNGTFTTTAGMKDLGSNNTVGETTVEDVKYDWKVNRYEGADGSRYVYPQNMSKGVWVQAGNTFGQYYFRANATDYAHWFEEKLNPNHQPKGYTAKNGIVIVDELPEVLKFEQFTTLELTLRGPLVSKDEYGEDYIVQGNAQVNNVNIAARPGVKIEQIEGQSYSDFYTAVTTAQAPCYGVFDEKIIIVNLGNLPSDETYLQMYNRLFDTNYESMAVYLKDRLGDETAELWLDKAKDVYTDDMKMWDYTVTFYARANWYDTDLDAQTKEIENRATMTYNNGEELEDSVIMQYHRTMATIQMRVGDIYILKADAKTQEGIDGVELKLQKYIGVETTSDAIRMDTTVGVWQDIQTLITGSEGKGASRWTGVEKGFYRIIEVKAADGYSIDSFEVYGEGKEELYIDGIFNMPEDRGIRIIAENTKYEDLEKTPTTIVFEGTKELLGRELKAEEFAFEVYDALDNVIQTVKNAEDGTIVFEPISYVVAGRYIYRIKEVVGSLVDIIYDQNVLTVVVEVTDNGDGTLTAVFDEENSDKILFSNIYETETETETEIKTKKETEIKQSETTTSSKTAPSNDSSSPKTGDTTKFILLGMALVLSSSVMSVLIYCKKKTKY
jgi:streptococcal pilin isopeptide linkage domain